MPGSTATRTQNSLEPLNTLVDRQGVTALEVSLLEVVGKDSIFPSSVEIKSFCMNTDTAFCVVHHAVMIVIKK
jgi:hypothetical protein